MNERKISVIIPVYNTEKFLRECLESVVSQRYSNWEAFLVDDGSQDDSYLICKEYKKRFPDNIIIKRLKRKGVSVARNYALKRAKGEYIVFLDSDDSLNPGLFEFINKNAIYDTDVFVGEFDSISDEPSNIEILISEKLDGSKIDGQSQEYVLDYFYDLRLIFTVWRFIVKTSLIKKNNLYMLPNIIHEDEEWVAKMLINSRSFKKIPFPHYVYRRRRDSITTSENICNYRCMLKVADKLLEYAEKEKCEYKKIFLYRCAYKNAAKVYFSVRNISKPSVSIEERGNKK